MIKSGKNSLGSGPQSKNQSYKKLMKKVQKDPKLQDLINQFQQNPNDVFSSNQTMTNQEKFRAKMDQHRQRRGSRAAQQIRREKQKENKKPIIVETKTEEEKQSDLNENVQNKINQSIEDITKQKKSQRDKMKKLQKKHGKITFERYSQALTTLSNLSTIKQDVSNREKNIIDLYIHQNPNIIEKRLDIDNNLSDFSDETSDSDMEDIDMENNPTNDSVITI